MEPIRVLLVDSEEVFREGLARLIDEQPNMEVVHQCTNGTEALRKTEETKPNVILIGSQTPEGDVLRLITDISASLPEVKVAVFARPGTEIAIVDTVRAGARGCLAKDITAADLVRSIELVSSGRIIISPAFAERFLSEIASPSTVEDQAGQPEQRVVSDRELQIVQLVARGASNKEIATELFIAENTVKVHVKNVLSKLELRNRQQLVAYAVLRNWVTLETSPDDQTREVTT